MVEVRVDGEDNASDVRVRISRSHDRDSTATWHMQAGSLSQTALSLPLLNLSRRLCVKMTIVLRFRRRTPLLAVFPR
jgi:hypothetical protein